MRTLAILTNGGDTCSLNASIKSVRDHAIGAGYTRILGFEEGFSGIIGKSVKLLTWEPIDPHQGGTVLRSQRYAPTRDDEMIAVFDILAELEVGVLIVIGGDGSLSAARDLYHWSDANGFRIRVLGFPRTIDNDIRTTTFEVKTEVALCPGYPSAALKIARFAKDLRTTAMASRKIFIIETMGRDAGWLAAAASLGGAELILIPEVELDDEDWDRFYERVTKLYAFHGHAIISVSEGFKIDGYQEMDAAFGPRKLGGIGIKVAKMVEKALKQRGVNVGVRYQQAGYIPRMGGPCAYDIELALALGQEIGNMLEDGRNGELPILTQVQTIKNMINYVSSIPLSRVEQIFFPADSFYNRHCFGVTDSFINFLKKFVNPREI